MKTKTYFILAATLLLSFLLVTQQACKKEDNPNQSPVCEIKTPVNGQEITKGETVTISVDATDTDGSIAEVRFSIDGVVKSSVTSSPYIYEWHTDSESTGSHTIKATSLDNEGGSTPDEISVTIIEGGSAPVADFIATPTSGTVPLNVNFTDQSTNEPTSWQWDFGNGGTSTQQNPSLTYDSDGTYSVTLTVSNEYGSDTKTITNYISVSSGSGSTFTDPRDGQTYNIVTIGSQTWFAENLNYQTADSWCYGNDPANCDVYGLFYNWNAAINACPNGWHISSDDEWKTLEMYLGMSQNEADAIGFRGTDEGNKLKSTSGWDGNGNGTDEVGFSAIPGGYRNVNGIFFGLRSSGNWWTATADGSAGAWGRGMNLYNDGVYRDHNDEENGFSVRCVRD